MASKPDKLCTAAFSNTAKVLGAGMHGKVVQSPQHTGRAIKIVSSQKFDQQEYEIGVLLGNLGVGPKVYGMHKCVRVGKSYHLITMAKLSMTLEQWLRKEHTKKELLAAHRDVMTLIRKLHHLGYTHSDLKTANIGLIGKKWVLIDFGWTYAGTRARRSPLRTFFSRVKHKLQGRPLPNNGGYEPYFRRQFSI